MEESAIQRTSVEIWIVILHYATETALLPFIDDSHNQLDSGILRNAELFAADGDAYREILNSKENTKNLRLVCRTWAAILSKSLNRCVLTSFGPLNLPGKTTKALERVERLQIVDFKSSYGLYSFRQNTLFFPPFVEPAPNFEIPWWIGSDDQTLKGFLSNVRILTISNPEFDLKRFLALMPGLRALSLAVHPNFEAISLLPKCVSNHSHLTHLSISNLNWREFIGYFGTRSHTFHSLRYLDIEFTRYPGGPNRIQGESVEWVIPRLHSLIIRGSVQATREDVEPFLYQCGQSVKEFIDFCPYRGLSASFGAIPFEDYFPHLSTYGTHFSFVIQGEVGTSEKELTSIREDQSSPRLLILEGFGPMYHVKPEDAATKLGSYMKSSGFGEVTLVADYFNRQDGLDFYLFEDPPSAASFNRWAEDFSQVFEKEGLKFTYRKQK
ncbi:hypothetical protein CPB86DRAFT_783528 [Serendipita vermifera]|nr:hypothetical protein CPB86DRAFT_783528 [Serendipita vermifera]